MKKLAYGLLGLVCVCFSVQNADANVPFDLKYAIKEYISTLLIMCICIVPYLMCRKREQRCVWGTLELTPRGKKTQKWTFFFLILLASIAVVLLPAIEDETAAMAENLYTSDGQWQKPKPRMANDFTVDRWSRKEFGIRWAWLVVDNGITCDAWYMKVHLPCLGLYLSIAFIPPVGFLVINRIRQTKLKTLNPSRLK